MKKRIFVLFFFVISTIANAAISQRHLQNLDGRWAFLVDPYESGFYDYRRRENVNGGMFKDRDWTKTKDLVEYDFDHSETLKVPGDWTSQRDDLKYYEGNIWYRRTFEAKLADGLRAFLRFDAVNYHCVVYFNGEKIGSHEGGFSPFEFEVTGLLKRGRNSLVLKVDNLRRAEGIPTVQTDWWNYGGITRSVWLEQRPQAYVSDWAAYINKEGKIEGWAKLEGAKGGEKMRLEIPELKAAAEAVFDAKGYAKLNLHADPQRWSPENPRQYKVRLSAGDDVREDEIGFRTLECKGPDILLNGKSVFLKGISIHDEAPGPKAGRMNDPSQARTLLSWAKDMGCNFVRLAHYPHPEFMVREAEKMGLMVWSEIPVYWTIQWENPATQALAMDQLESMIRRDRNRAAVIIWSVGNETPLSEPRHKFMKGLARRARELDPTRLLSAALETHGGQERELNDTLGEDLDVLGMNEYIGWYDGPPEKARTITWKTKWDKPLVISEFGADAKKGRHGKEEERWNEEYQAFVYREQLAMLSKIPNFRGLSPWILKDFRSPRRWLPGVQDGWNRKGLLSETGQKKAAFEVLKSYYKKKD